MVREINQHAKHQLKGFANFVREQGVVGLAVGFLLGSAVSKLVSSLVNDIINPMLALVLGSTEDLEGMVINISTAQIKIGSFLSVLIDFLVIAGIVYLGLKLIGLDKLDKKKK